MLNCVSTSASVFAEARQRQVRLRSTSYAGTSRPHILRHQFNEPNTYSDNESKICCQYRFLEVELRIQADSGIAHSSARGWIFLKAGFHRITSREPPFESLRVE